ncbi:hypothetical protein EW146_g8038 [Bondarzewia mesenterica]|uniref:Nudix hydrolase domain-containing protein n=1 Tax=Bondarzewia mesenterica TaxID=1095465 RepID=A0A4S4LJD4_9AGAM|nr:hypothetical protein EW146_g8038 [Bondarzewia mesenterica]
MYTRTTENTLTHRESIVPFFVAAPTDNGPTKPVGYLRPLVLRSLEEHHASLHSKHQSPWEFGSNAGGARFVSFSSSVNEGGKESRTFHINQLAKNWKEKGFFEDILRGWSNEAFPIYHHSAVSHNLKSFDDSVAFSIERAALPLFGFANFGCLLTAYYQSSQTGKTMFWIPRRSKTKKNWPGRLDVTVGGGINVGDTAASTIIRECFEEASLDVHFVANNLQPVGVLPYPNRSPAGWILPGLYYLFDLPLPSDGSLRPRVNAEDGEVENFELMDAQTVLDNLLAGVFKPSSALALVDFLIRHGFVTEDTDPRFVDTCLELRRTVPLPVPWRV